MKNFLLLFLYTIILLPEGNAQADVIQRMKDAQAALALGDYDKAFTSYLAAAENDRNALAQFSLGLLYQHGWGRTIDKALACEWFEKAAQGGIPTAQHLTGVCFEDGISHSKDPAQAAIWYQKAAQAGHLHSYCHLGNLYMAGKGLAKDPIKALELCHPAAQQGSIPAQIAMGKFYLDGDSSIQNMQEAYRWFESAAQKRNPEAFYYLGIIATQSLPQTPSSPKTRQMFERAAALKYVPAYFQAGKHFHLAEPDPETHQLSAEHLAKAYMWLSAAIQQSGNPEEVVAAKEMIRKTLAVMPSAWLAELDQKVAQHIQEN
jgi:TPR repeat protein